MIGFLLRKSFYDAWDNLFRLGLLNLGFIVSLIIPVFGPTLFVELPLVATAVMVLGAIWLCVYLSAMSRVVSRISDYGSFGFGDFFRAIPGAIPGGLILSAVILVLFYLFTGALPYYIGKNTLLGLFGAALIFWSIIVAFLALQWFFAIRARLDKRLFKSLKKCFIIFFDNGLFSLFALLHNVVLLALSSVMAFLLPGPAAALLFLDQALRLRLMKYDWLEAHPEANPKKIPWEELILDDREKTGVRSFKNFIFPWKD